MSITTVINLAPATISEEIEEQILHPRLRHNSNSSTKSKSSSSKVRNVWGEVDLTTFTKCSN